MSMGKGEPSNTQREMGWFKRLRDGIQTATKNKKEVPDGLWVKCPSCKEASTSKDMRDNLHICPNCNYHHRIGSHDYFDLLYDDQEYKVHFEELESQDFLEWQDLKSYDERLVKAKNVTSVDEAITVASGKSSGRRLVTAAMDFSFIGGSMGSVVGERIALAIEYCLKKKAPLLIISKSGGARMMESAFSLMQLAKTSALLTRLAKAKIPYLSLLTDPTTGGVTASFAMLGDINFAEPKALIGFAGPRVIKETIKQELPEGFQTSEFLLDHGFLDFIVARNDLKTRIGDLLTVLLGK